MVFDYYDETVVKAPTECVNCGKKLRKNQKRYCANCKKDFI